MKICAACSQTLPKEKFSKKQWQLKQCRRCKECIAVNREAKLGANDDCAVAEEAPRHTDEDLFKQTPPIECPICMLPLPLDEGETTYQACCGKTICNGCMDAVEKGDEDIPCPFCRTPVPKSDAEYIKRIMKRVEANDPVAVYNLGCNYYNGRMSLQQNKRKAMKLWFRAGELGHDGANFNLGISYDFGEGAEKDEKKAKYHYELAAMGGYVKARHNLGILEQELGNMERAVKHWMIAAMAGYDNSLNAIRQCYLEGHATKDDFEKALRAHKHATDEMKSDHREAAAADHGHHNSD